MKDLKDTYLEQHFKDQNPFETVKNIKNCFEDLGLALEESWAPSTKTGTHSVRLKIKGISMEIGSNGKGTSKEYARASAYGELCERIQNQLFSLCSGYGNEEEKFYVDEQYMTIHQAIEEDTCFLPLLFKRLSIDPSDQSVLTGKLEQLFGNEPVLMRPFYSWKQKKIVQIPWNIAGKFYGSNGMSAGNTMEEALVQGLSEVIERHVQGEIMRNPRALPDIPDSYIKQYPEIEAMYQKLKRQKAYEILVKDCSLNEGYPVAGLILIKKGTGDFGIKVGCHPNLGIALERCFTEAFQGLDEESFSSTSKLDFSNHQTEHYLNIYNTYKTAFGQYPWQLLLKGTASHTMPDCGIKSNREMLEELLTLLISKGYDVLFRDVSFLGIPSYQVVVPGMSEMLPISEKMIRANNSMTTTKMLLKKSSALTPKDCSNINLNARFWKNSLMENSMTTQYNLPLELNLPGDEHGNGLVFLELATYYATGKTEKAIEAYKEWENKERRNAHDIPPFYQVLFHYLVSVAQSLPSEETIPLLKKFYAEDIVDHVYDIFSDPEQCMKQLYPDLNCYECEHCSLKAPCGYPDYKDILQKLWKKQKEVGMSQEQLIKNLEKIQEIQ